MSGRFDAAVIGAGPAGAAVAQLLARAGWSVALVERQRFPRRKVCGECIAASNLPLLDSLGIGEAFAREAGGELRRVALFRRRDSIVASLPPGEDGGVAALPSSGMARGRALGGAFGRALGRERLDTLLADAAAAAGASRLQPMALRRIEGDAGRYRLHLQGAGDATSRREIEAALVVAAHGSWEPLPFEREAARRARRASDLFAFKANFRAAAIDADLLPVLSFRGGYGGMVVADGGLATLACCIREDRLDAVRAGHGSDNAGAAVEALLRRECSGVEAALQGAVRDGAWIASGPLRPGVRLGAGDAIFRVGNAAGEAHPIVGEGISMALQSAFLLAATIAGHREALTGADAAAAQRRLRRDYEQLWRHRFALRLRLAAAFAHLAMRPEAADLAWPLVRRWPQLLTTGARWSGKTRCAAEALRLAAAL